MKKNNLYIGFVCAMIALSLFGMMSRFMSTHSTSDNQRLIVGKWEDVNKERTLTFTKTKVTITKKSTKTYAYSISGGTLTINKTKYSINKLDEDRLLITKRNGLSMKSYDFRRK
jgi:hypothetical protein